MGIPVSFGHDLAGTLANAPTNLEAGMMYFDNVANQLYVQSTTAGVAGLVPVNAGAGVTGSRPSSPTTGQLYFDTTLGQLVVWNGTAWVLEGGGTPNDAANGLHAVRTARFQYNPSGADSKLTGTFDTGVLLPANAIILSGIVEVNTSFTSLNSTATLAIQAEAANDIVTATAVGATWNAGRHATIPVGTAATSVKVSTAKTVKVLVAVEAVTAGKLTGFLNYVVGA